MWKEKLMECLAHWDKKYLVSSPDIDGLLSAAILIQQYKTQLIGLYTTTHLILFEPFAKEDALQALWVDQDIDHSAIQSIGQHLISLSTEDRLESRNPYCFNPNFHYNQAWSDSFLGLAGTKRDKYPFGTCHMLMTVADLDERSLTPREMALLAHADGTVPNIYKYRKNCGIWRDLMFSESFFLNSIMQDYSENKSFVETHQKLVEELEEAGISKRSSSTQKRDLPKSIQKLTGYQSLPYRINTTDEKFVRKYNDIASVVRKDTRFDVPLLSQISIISGEVQLVYPNQVSTQGFDAFLSENKVFSHAFTAQKTLRYTIMPDFPDD